MGEGSARRSAMACSPPGTRSRPRGRARASRRAVACRKPIPRRGRTGSRRLGCMLEEPLRIDGRLEATLRIPDRSPAAIVVIAHALPTHGGTMRTPIMAAIARACAARGWYALRFNFRGVGESAGTWSGGRDEPDDLAAAVAHARAVGRGLPLALVGYSFGAFAVLAYLARGGPAPAVALVGIGTKDVNFAPRKLPLIPPGTFIVAAEHDQFGTPDELRAIVPDAGIAVVKGVDHF